MTTDNEKPSKSTQTDQLRHTEPSSGFWSQRSLPQRPFFETLYGSLESSYNKIQEALDAVVPLTVTLLGSVGLTRKPFSVSSWKNKGVNTGYGMFVQPELILTISSLFELPVDFRLGVVSYNDEECELLDMPESFPSPTIGRLRYLRTKRPHPHVVKIEYGFPSKRDVFSILGSF